MDNRKNLISAIFLQIVTIISGLILPRLIIIVFGSEVNGMVSSITQFLGFISILEGGLGAVVLAELYKPIEKKNEDEIKEILIECQNFFGKLSIVFIIYTIILAILYPIISNSDKSFGYISGLVIILSISTLIRYIFAITKKLYLQASQRMYIVNNVSSVVIILNLVFAFIILKIFPQIHILKSVSDIVFLLQPVILKHFVEKKYRIKLKLGKTNNNVLKNRWSGFAQNLAYFVTSNTDIVVITILIGLNEVSVYSIYMLAINAIRTFISLISNSYQTALGKYYASEENNKLKEKYLKLEKYNLIITLIMYSVCMLLINDFVNIYTIGINDAEYYQPIFACIIVIANMFFSICEPSKFFILALGKFKETTKCYMTEAALNILISLILSKKYGLVGVAIGTLVSILYRFFYYVVFFKNNILFLEYKYYLKKIIFICFILIINIYCYIAVPINIKNFFEFFEYGILLCVLESILIFSTIFMDKIIKKIKNKCNL